MEYTKYISFLNPNDTCHPGEVLRGELILTLDKARTYKGIHVLLSGFSESEWKEKEKKEVNGSTKTSNETYKGKKQYFEEMIGIVGPSTALEFSAGTHKFPFSFTLPNNLPPSIKGTHGHCTYIAKAVLDRPWRPNETVKKNFTVETKYHYPMRFLAPKIEESVEELWCLPFKTVPFKLNVEVAQQAFQVGDGIPINVQIEHESNTTIYELKFQLRQILHIYSMTPTRKFKAEFNKILDIRCKVMDSRKIGKFQRILQIPHLPVTYTSISELVSVLYEIKVEVKVGGLNKNPSIRVPIIIGTGVNENAPHNTSRDIGFVLTNESIIGSSSFSPQPPSSQQQRRDDEQESAAPPSYDEAVVAASPIKQ